MGVAHAGVQLAEAGRHSCTFKGTFAMRTLIVTTSCNQLPSGHPTGLWAEEYAVPYMALKKAGVEIVVASPAGGVVPVDEKSRPDPGEAKEWAPALAALQSTVPLAAVQEQEFDLIFLPGGHGPLVDLAGDATLQRLLSRQDASGRLIGSVCHGPAALLDVRRHDGSPLLQGRRVTGFTNTEERLAGLHDKVPFLLEDEMKARGADFHSALLPMLSHVERDGNLLTGQNPKSSHAIAKAMVEALNLAHAS
jgi:putative intracellular protease/amidase